MHQHIEPTASQERFYINKQRDGIPQQKTMSK